ncbi:MAG: SNF2-like helicase [Hyperionvirus sp.]|uniref:SNF2-like helicase n=1 Tax=Hyperionvirus sp. TaxID=2487770 RepID=A0A3G5ACG9_9VIRU|nr:MAG: SNF2-like helicase [Hyperionvirus sp.]
MLSRKKSEKITASTPDEIAQKEKDNIDEQKLMEQNFSYPDPSNPDIQYEMYRRREFYAHRIPPRPDIHNYSDIKEYRDNICAREFTLHEHQALLSNFINPDTPYRGLLVFHGLGSGKCTTADTNVLTNGNLLKMRDIWNTYSSRETITDFEGGEWSVPTEELIINSIDSNGAIIKKTVKRLYREKINATIREVELENGHKISITPAHKLLKNNGWENDLNIGEYIAIPKKVYNCPEKNLLRVSEDLAFLFAWHINGGHQGDDPYCTYISNHNDFMCNDFGILKEIKNRLPTIASDYDLYFASSVIKYPTDQVPYLKIVSKDYIMFLAKNGYVAGKLPDFIMNAPLNCIKIFLQAFFDAQSSIDEKSGTIEIFNASEMILKQLVILCRLFEINMKIKTIHNRTRTYYTGLICGPSLRLFKEKIGYTFDFKKEILDRISERKYRTNLEILSNITIKTLQDVRDETKLPASYFKTVKQTIIKLQDVLGDNISISKYKLESKIDFIKRAIGTLQRELAKEVYWIKIKSINRVAYDDYVYDLEVDETHNYVADGILCHNTCAGVAIAEKFKSMVQKYNTKIYVLVSGPLIKETWKHHLLKCTGETYLKYQDKSLYIDPVEQAKLQKNALNQALQYYRFMSYRSFYKRVLGEKIVEKKVVKGSKVRVSYRKTEEGEFERDIAVDRIYNLNNTIIMVDEAHNLTGNAYGEALMYIIKNSVNLRIVLLTATPMKNLADDIIPLLNFIRPQNAPAERDKIFDSNKNHLMKFKENGLQYLKDIARGYISHVRGADPLIFARRIDKGVQPPGLLFTKVVQCRMLPFQKKIYDIAIQTRDDTLDRRSEAVANFVFPALSQDRKEIVGLYGREGVLAIKNQLKTNHDLLNKKIASDILHLDSVPPDLLYITEDGKNITGSLLKMVNLKHFSIKFYKALKKTNRLIWGKKGPRVAFVYSNLVKVGIEIFQQILLQNGYLEYQDKMAYQNAPTTVCYFCGKTFKEHQTMVFAEDLSPSGITPTMGAPEYERLKNVPGNLEDLDGGGAADSDSDSDSDDDDTPRKMSREQKDISESSTDYEGYPKKHTIKPIPKHQFAPATFISVTGKSSEESAEFIPEDKKRILDDVFNDLNNINGKYIKLVLGSKVMNEGISLKNVAEVHVLDVYFNLGKVDQVAGRAIRQCSHFKLMSEETKFPFVNVYKYVVTVEGELSTEEELYRKAELKYMLIKKVERAMKEVAIDCPLNVYGNMFKEEIEQFKDCGDEGKEPCPPVCDYQKCIYKCDDVKLNAELYDPERNIYKRIGKEKLDYSTFTHGLARNEIEYAKRKIKELYLIKYEYTLNVIIDYVKNSYDEEKRDLFDEFFVFKGLDELIPITENDFISFKDTIVDKFNRPGYLIYVGVYYIFQPLDQNEDVPMYYRTMFDKTITQRLSLYNYLKNTIQYQKFKGQKVKKVEEEESILKEEVSVYNFEPTLEYYDNRDEFKYVGIIDKELSRRKSKGIEDMRDVFKIREKRSKILEKKRGTGIPSFKGAVCSTSKNKEYLENIAAELKIDSKDNDTRIDLCDKIRDKMYLMEKYNEENLTYLMVPANHPTVPFPLNIYDRVKFIRKQIQNMIKFKLQVSEASTKKKDGPEKGYATISVAIKDEPRLVEFEKFLSGLGGVKEKGRWVITVS